MSDETYPVMFATLSRARCLGWSPRLMDADVFDGAYSALHGQDVAVIQLDVYQRLVDGERAARNPDAIQTQSEPAAVIPFDQTSWQIPCSCGCPGSVAVADIQPGDRDVRPDDMIAVASRPYRTTFTRENGYLYEHRIGSIHGPDTRSIQQIGRSHWMQPADPPDDEPPFTAEPRTFAAQIRAHAERAGYDFQDLPTPPGQPRTWWRVRGGAQLLLVADPNVAARTGSAWQNVSDADALRIAESWPSTPNHEALEQLDAWMAEPPEPKDSALEEHLAEQRMDMQALDVIAVLLDLADDYAPLDVVEAVRDQCRELQRARWLAGAPTEPGEYWTVYRRRDGSDRIRYERIFQDDLHPWCVGDIVAHMVATPPRYPR